VKAAKPKVGRPRVPKKLAKGSLLSVRFSDDERKLLDQAAVREGVRLSESPLLTCFLAHAPGNG
jgi:uncharacterized protein (DUF1778 family)